MIDKFKINNRKDILLLLLYSPGQSDEINEPIIGRTRLVKMMFLFREEILEKFKKGIEINEENFYQFFPWNFGPFSTQVYDDITFFILQGFIYCNESNEDMITESAEELENWKNTSGIDYVNDEMIPEYQEDKFILTDKGLEFTKKLYDNLSSNQKNILREFKKNLSKASLRTILRYVYQKYPDQIEKTKIGDKILDS